MPFLKDYLFFNSGNEGPENYHIFSALSLASSVIRRKVYLEWGLQRIYTNLYTCLVGTQGSRKGVGKDHARDIHVEFFPNIPIGPSVSSPQAICKELASDACTMAFNDDQGVTDEVHSMSFYIGELKHFLGINQIGMIDLLTDAYDNKYIDTNYISREKEIIPNPYLVLLACETPEWILTRLKTDVISGGFARRIILVYEKAVRERIALPFVTPDMLKARDRVVSDLKELSKMVGRMVWTPEASKFYENWYTTLKAPPDRLMEGYYSSKHTQMLKIATILTLIENKNFLLTPEILQLSIALLDRIEPGMTELLSGVGRNELAQPTDRLLSYVKSRGGLITEKEFLIAAHRDMTPSEANGVLVHLIKTEQLVMLSETTKAGIIRKIVATKDRAESLATKPPPPASQPPGASPERP